MEALSEMDVYAHPALEECCCMTIVEAMSLGVPVIGGQSSGGVPWQLENGNSGILVDVRSPYSIASGILALVSDEKRYDTISRRSVVRAQELFAREKVAASYERTYENLLDQVRPEPLARAGSHA